MLRGARGHIYRYLADNGPQCRVSLVVLACDTGYSLPTVQLALRELQRDQYIRCVEAGGPRRAAAYEVLQCSDSSKPIHGYC